LVQKPERKRPHGIHRRRWEDNIRMGLREIRWEIVDWIRLAQDRYRWRSSCEHGNEPLGSIKGRDIPE